MGHKYELNKTTSSGIREIYRGSRYLRPHGSAWQPSEYHLHTPPARDAAPDGVTPCGCMVWNHDDGFTVRCAVMNQPGPLRQVPRCHAAACALMTAHCMWTDDEDAHPSRLLGMLRARGLWYRPYRSDASDPLYFGSVLTVDPGDGTRMQVSSLYGGGFVVVSYPVEVRALEWEEAIF